MIYSNKLDHKTSSAASSYQCIMSSKSVQNATSMQQVLTKIHPYRDLLCVKEDSCTYSTADRLSDNKYENTPNGFGGIPSSLDEDFEPPFHPSQMRCLALVSHNEMKASMKSFVLSNKNILKKFRLTGTNSTMLMLKEVFKDDESVVYGPSCSSGPLGGDAELVALMCADKLGGMIFFQDPMSAHPHQSDIDCLCRQALVHNTMIAANPTSALMMMTTLRVALRGNMPELIPSFFFTLQSPSVCAYKKQQSAVIASHSSNALNSLEVQQQEQQRDRETPSASISPTQVGSLLSSAADRPAPVFEMTPGIVPPARSRSSTIDSTRRSRITDTLNATATSAHSQDDIDDDSQSLASTMSRASVRRVQAEERLMESFASFIYSIGKSTIGSASDAPSSMTRSNHNNSDRRVTPVKRDSRNGVSSTHHSYLHHTATSSSRRIANRPKKFVTRRITKELSTGDMSGSSSTEATTDISSHGSLSGSGHTTMRRQDIRMRRERIVQRQTNRRS